MAGLSWEREGGVQRALQSRYNTLWDMAGWAVEREDGWGRRGFAEPVQFAQPPPPPVSTQAGGGP